MTAYPGPALVTLATSFLLFACAAYVGRCRIRFGIKAPAASGHPQFDVAYRIQANTVENSVAFLPVLWVFAVQRLESLGDRARWRLAAGAGLVRARLRARSADSRRRLPGFDALFRCFGYRRCVGCAARSARLSAAAPAGAGGPGAPQVAAARRLQPLRDLLPHVARYRRQVGLALLFLLLAAGATLALPYAVKLLVDGWPGAAARRDAPEAQLAAIREHFLLLFGVSLLLGLATAARYYMVSWIGERVTTDLRQAVYAHVLGQSPQFFETLKTGEVPLAPECRHDGHSPCGRLQCQHGAAQPLLLLLGGLAMLLTTTPRLMLSVAGIIVLVVLPAVLIARRVRKLSRASQDRLADTGGIAGEVLNAVPVVQSYGREAAEAERFGRANEEAFAASMRRTGTRSALTAFVIIGVFASLLYGMYGGVRAVLAGEISAGQLSQTALYVMVVAGSVAVLAEVWGDLLRAAGATERLMELLAAHSPIVEPARPVSLAEPAGGLQLRFSDVQFAYPSRPTARVLHGLALSIPAGQTVALVGPSGAGKTTVFQLLQRFYDVAGGAILVDGVDLRRLSLAELRRRIAVVPQEAVIFSGSIADNIAYGRAGASPDEVRQPPPPPSSTTSSVACPTATTPSSANAACACRVVSGSASPSRGRC
jgi:ATP-binding cassette subfamily B protein